MKRKFVKLTLALSLLMVTALPTASFAGTSCNIKTAAPSNQSIVKSSNNCSLSQLGNYLGKQINLNGQVNYKLDDKDCGFVPSKNQNNKNQNVVNTQKPNSSTNSNSTNSSCGNKQTCGFNQNCNLNSNCTTNNKCDIDKNCGTNGNCTTNNNCNLNNNCGSNNNGESNNNGNINNNNNSGNINNGNSNNGNTNSGNDNTNVDNNIGTYEAQVVALVNQERAKAGLSPLKLNTKLANVAEKKAEDMRDNNYFSHTSPTYGSPFDMMKQFGVTYSTAGENIAKGQKTADSVMSAWMNSSGHRANILSSNFDEIGVGYTTDSKGNTYWVQMFIK